MDYKMVMVVGLNLGAFTAGCMINDIYNGNAIGYGTVVTLVISQILISVAWCNRGNVVKRELNL